MSDSRFIPFAERHEAAYGRWRKTVDARSRDGLSTEDREILDQAFKARQASQLLKKSRGKRYLGCTFENFVTTSPAQEAVVEALKAYGDDPASLEDGRNVVLFGGKGCGKDHLLMALAKRMNRNFGVYPRFENGIDFHDRKRRELLSDHDSETDKDADREAPILWISDPLPPTGVLSEFQQSQMLGVLDARYSNLRPTWVTLNVVDGAEAESRIGAQAIDRLRHGALTLHCNWASYRTAATAQVEGPNGPSTAMPLAMNSAT